MSDANRKILICVEGEKQDVKLMEKLFQLYGIDVRYEIVSYKTNMYTLYNIMFADGDPDSMDLLQVLKEREPLDEKKKIFNEKYSDILLVFDMDPQDPQFSPDKLIRMAEYFHESTDTGKLYINYPMVEAFYHMKFIPDPDYPARCATLEEIRGHKYKARVNRENRNHDYTKFAVNKCECSTVIEQNIEKAWTILEQIKPDDQPAPLQSDILHFQLVLFKQRELVSVLSTCVFFIAEYNPKLLS